MIDNVKCTLGKNNFLDVKFFVRRKEDCQAFCGKLVNHAFLNIFEKTQARKNSTIFQAKT